MQRIVTQLFRLLEQVVEDPPLGIEVTLQQGLREVVLIAEMVEETGFGDAGFTDDLVDRGGGEAFVQHGVLRDVHDALARLFAFAQNLHTHFAISTRGSNASFT